MNILEYYRSFNKNYFIVLFSLFLLLFPLILHAGQIGENIEIASLAYDQQNPHTIFILNESDPENSLWFVVWEDWRNYNSTGADIYGRLYDSNGNPCGSEFVISNANGNQTVPRAAYRSADSKIVVVWQDTRPNYIKYRRVSITDFSTCSVDIGLVERDVGFNEIEEYIDNRGINTTTDIIGTGDGSRSNFAAFLTNIPVVPGTAELLYNSSTLEIDSGHGKIGYYGEINYNTGFVRVSFSSAPSSGDVISIRYYYYSGNFILNSIGDTLIARHSPKIVFNKAKDEFWIVWKETRDIIHRLSEICFPNSAYYLTSWEFGDTDFIGYVRLQGSNITNQKSSLIGVNGADIIRNSRNTTLRETSRSRNPLAETITYEYFDNVNNPDIACDETSTQCFIVFEGTKRKATLKCNCKDENLNDYCDLADNVTDTLTLECSNTDCTNSQCFTHIFGIFDNQIPMNVLEFKKIDTAKYSFDPSSYYPSVGFDYISKKFLVTWEDMRAEVVRDCVEGSLVNENTKKIWGRLVYSGGDLYGLDFMISYEDTDNNGTIDSNVRNSKQTRPHVSYDPVNQRFFVVWQDSRNGLLSLENIDIFGQKVDAEGSLRGLNFPVFTLPHNQYLPTIAYNDFNNNFLVLWKDARNADNSTCSLTGGTGTGSYPCGSDVYGQRYSLGNPSLTLLNMDNTPLTPPLLSNFENPSGSGGVEVGLSDTKSFKIRNTGDTVLKIDYINEDLDCNPGTSPNRTIEPFSFDGLPSQLLYDDGITLDLVPASELVFTVRFTPVSGGSFNRCFIIESDGGSPRVNLSGLAKEPDITLLTPSEPYNFGSVYIGSFRDVTFTFKNIGIATLRIYSLNNPVVPFSIQSSTCSGSNIAPGATCNVVVRFTPTVAGVFNSEFHVNSNDPDTPSLVIHISGTGVGAQDITVNPLSIDFGNVQVGQISQKNITIKNDGTAPLTISSITSPVAPFTIPSNTCSPYPRVLNVGNSCNVTVQFAPVASGGVSSSITINSDDPDEGSIDVSLTGAGVTTPDIFVDPTFVNFPSTPVGSTSSQTIEVRNIGSANLTITSVTNPGGDFNITGTDCIGTLIPTATCHVSITFAPTSAGFKQTTFQINSNDPDTPAYSVYLSGTGAVEPNIYLIPTALNFGNVIVGNSSTLNLTVKNIGPANLLIISVSIPSAPYSIVSNTCLGMSLAQNETCQIQVMFSPTSQGNFPSSITINTNDPDTPNAVVNLNGSGIVPANVSVNPLIIDFGSVVVGTSSTPRTVTVTNNGGTNLEILSVKYPGSPFRIVSDTCKDETLLPGGSCSITIVFNPTRVAYFTAYYLVINTNDADQPKVKVNLRGKGVSP